MHGTDLSQLILDLYHASRRTPFAAFQSHALELLKPALPFDSAWWGNASANPAQIHRIYLYNCDRQIIDDYPNYLEQDFFRVALSENPGRSINMSDLTTRARYVRSALYREFGKRYRIEWSLGTLLIEPVSSLQEFLTLWRHDPTRPFTERERQIKQFVMPHLAEAQRLNRLHHVMGWYRTMHNASWAIADRQGYLRELSPRFVHMLRNEWPDWGGSSRLPDEITASLQGSSEFVGRRLVLQIAETEGLLFLKSRLKTSSDRLSPRERDIAVRYAHGETYAAIARQLGLSPATVRNYIAQCFRKLQVKSKLELARRLEGLRAG